MIDLNQTESESRRDKGIERAAANAETDSAGWLNKAVSFINKYPHQEFMIEQIRAFAYEGGLAKPPHERAWGRVATLARSRGIISFVRFDLVKNSRAHRTPAAVWRRKEQEAA